MACEQAVVTLTPVYSPDTLPFRSLTFSSNNDTVPIGRASKSETKNLVPGHDNGWFDSRVMSREHGVISVSLENKAVYIRDHGSLHGTQLNDATITPKQNVAVKSGDVLTFGSEISRGTQTFRPIAVRLDCQWHEKRIAPATTKPTVNTFCVPDEEDDVVEVVHYKEVTVQQKASQCASDSSDLDYGSDMSRPLDLTSPVTSPEIKTSQLPNQLPVETNNATGVQQTSSEAVIPPSSPPAQSEDEDQPESEEEDDGSESDDSAGEETNDFFEGGSEASEDDHYEGSDWDEQESALADAQAPPFSVFQGSMARPFATLDANAEEINLPTHENQATSQIPNQSDVTNQTRDSTSVVQEQSLISTTLPQQGFTLPEYAIPRIPSPSDKAMAKPLGIPAPAPAYNPYSISPALQAWARGKHLPSSSTLNNTMGLTNSFESTNANESFPFGPHRSSGYLRNLANGAPESQPIWSQDLKSRRSNIEKLRALTKVENPVNKPTTRVSVSKIVEANIQNHPSTTKNLKRKVDEYMADLDDDSKETGNTQDSITDAQPRPDMQNLELTQSQTAKTQSIPEVGPSSPKESRRKRVKTHQVYTFMKYAAISAVGAAVGSIGTIAGLSSLPADYFN